MKLSKSVINEFDRELNDIMKHELFHETAFDVDDEIDSEIEWDMNYHLSKNKKVENLCDDEDDEDLLLCDTRIDNEVFQDALDSGEIFDHNFLYDKLEQDREDGNLEGEYMDIRELYGTEGLERYLETGNPEEE